MRDMGLSGARRGRAWTATTDSGHPFDRPTDLVDRSFAAPAPNRLQGGTNENTNGLFRQYFPRDRSRTTLPR